MELPRAIDNRRLLTNMASHPSLRLASKLLSSTRTTTSTTALRQTKTRLFQYPYHSSFHNTARAMVQVGDSVPSVELMEGSPGNKVNLATELASGNGLIIGVPAAYSMSCS